MNFYCLWRLNSWKKSRQKSYEFSSLLFTVNSTALPWDLYFFKLMHPLRYFYSWVTVKEKGGKPDRKPYPLPYSFSNPYRNLKSENSQDYSGRALPLGRTAGKNCVKRPMWLGCSDAFLIAFNMFCFAVMALQLEYNKYFVQWTELSECAEISKKFSWLRFGLDSAGYRTRGRCTQSSNSQLIPQSSMKYLELA